MIDPAESVLVITPNDSTDLSHRTRALFVGYGGHLSVEMADGTTVTFYNVQNGSILPIQIDVVNSTGTTASGILGLY